MTMAIFHFNVERLTIKKDLILLELNIIDRFFSHFGVTSGSYLLGVNFTPFPQITERRLVQTTELLASSFVFS